MQTDPSPVRKAAESPQASVRQRAAALLKLLGANGDEAPAGAPRGAQPAGVADLMGGLNEPDEPGVATTDIMGNQSICCLIASILTRHLLLPSTMWQTVDSRQEVHHLSLDQVQEAQTDRPCCRHTCSLAHVSGPESRL